MRVFNKIQISNQITDSNFKPKPNKARFKSKPNKAQTGYKMRGESFNTGLEVSVDDLPAVPNLLINLDLELHGVPTGLAIRRLSHYDPASKTTPFGRQKNERNVLGTTSVHEVKEEEEKEEEERWRGGDYEEVRSCCCWNSWKSRRRVCGEEG